jgi:hypothetical protein
LIEFLNRILNQVKEKMTCWANKGRIALLIKQDEMADDIKKLHQAIDTCLTKFQFTSHLEIHEWKAEFTTNTKRDHVEIVAYLSDIQNGQAITHEAMAYHNEILHQLMALMQNHLTGGSSQSGRDRSQIGLQTNLHHLQKHSGELLPDFNLKHGEVKRLGDFPVSGSAAMDIWEGLYLGQEKVAVKVIRAVHSDPRSLKGSENMV